MTARTRPLSPHLQIYRLPLTALLSITHRLTGLWLSAAGILLVYWLRALASGPDAYTSAQVFFKGMLGQGLLMLISAAFYFHLANGIRHLFWDAGYGFDLKSAGASGYAVIVMTIVMSVLTWVLIYF